MTHLQTTVIGPFCVFQHALTLFSRSDKMFDEIIASLFKFFVVETVIVFGSFSRRKNPSMCCLELSHKIKCCMKMAFDYFCNRTDKAYAVHYPGFVWVDVIFRVVF